MSLISMCGQRQSRFVDAPHISLLLGCLAAREAEQHFYPWLHASHLVIMSNILIGCTSLKSTNRWTDSVG